MPFRKITTNEKRNIELLRTETLSKIDMSDIKNNNITSNEFIKYYMFDWDDNLFYMDSMSYLLRGTDVVAFTTEEYALLGKDKEELKNYSIYDRSFVEFRDNNAFKKHFIDAITSLKVGKSWISFIKCILKANIFAIITNRGHDLYVMREAITWIINHVFSLEEKNLFQNNLRKFANIIDTDFPITLEESINYYLDVCDIYCINSIYFLAKTGMTLYEDSNPAKKVKAVEMFAQKVHNFSKLINKKAKLGFSDDDVRNIEAIRDCMKDDLSNRYENIDLIIYKTGNEYIKQKI